MLFPDPLKTRIKIRIAPPRSDAIRDDLVLAPSAIQGLVYLDSNNDNRVSENEWDGSLATFDRFDRNRDGWLSSAELGSVRPPSPFRTVDTNNDGRITMSEWPWSRRTFIQQDADSNGAITRQEYRGGGGEQ